MVSEIFKRFIVRFIFFVSTDTPFHDFIRDPLLSKQARKALHMKAIIEKDASIIEHLCGEAN